MAAWIILLLCVTFSGVKAQSNYVLKGIVKDELKGDALPGASILVNDANGKNIGSVQTDANGKFEIKLSKPTPYRLTVTYVGYVKLEISVKDANSSITIKLKSNQVNLKSFDIVGSRLSQKQKESPLTVEALDAIGIRETPAANFYEGLGQLKGVDLTSASIGFKVINTRGFNSTSPVRSLQLIDGVDNQAPGLNFSLGNFLGASELDVQKVDLVVGASSAYFGPNAFNGVVSMQTKNPFQTPGLSAMIKTGERNLVETGIRYAEAYKTADGFDRFAWKLNLSYMRANDWEATNLNPTPDSKVGPSNPGGYDAVNRYGDESFYNGSGYFDRLNTPGLGYIYRKGYDEKNLVDYNTYNLKMGLALHYKLKKGTEFIYSSGFGAGTTVYQGENRFSLRDILFFQNRFEVRKEGKWFIRAYASNEDAGNSYDAVATAVLLQRAAKPDVRSTDNRGGYFQDYYDYWQRYISNRVRNLPGFVSATPLNAAQQDAFLNQYRDSLAVWHQMAAAFANGIMQPNLPFPYLNAQNFYEPGTARFDSMLNLITSKTSYNQGGSRFWDRSALYHIMGEYRFKPAFGEIVVGGSFRQYNPNSQGTIFSDSNGVSIVNREFGFYSGLEKQVFNQKAKLNLTLRLDKNQNFNLLASPAASLVYRLKNDGVVRVGLSAAIRNPTLQDQYLNYYLGTARLVGNLNGFDSLVTIESLKDRLNSGNDSVLRYFNVAGIRPEKVQTLEVGYRATWFKQMYIDFSAYASLYQDFIGYKIGAYFDKAPGISLINNIRVLRVATNSIDQVMTMGASVGINYFFRRFYSFNANYSWNRLDRMGSTDPLIPAFNTPTNKFNIGISGRDIVTRWLGINWVNVGFSVNYKWVEGFRFEGSPQFTGAVPTYDMFDAQVNYRHAAWKSTFKLGANNLFNNKAIQVYGGPAIGRLAYISVIVDLADKRK